MTTAVTFANAVDREADYLRADLSPDFPALLRTRPGSNDAPFDYIGPRLVEQSQAPRQVHVYRERVVEMRAATGVLLRRHDLLLAVLWPISNVTRADTAEQLALDNALDRLVGRVRGNFSDHTHREAFWTVAQSIEGGENIDVRYPDWRTATMPIDAPLAAGDAYVVEVRYSAWDDVEDA